jgi:hypothetical protein
MNCSKKSASVGADRLKTHAFEVGRTVPSTVLPNLDSLRDRIAELGYDLRLDGESIANISALGFRGENLPLALVATNILLDEEPITLRGLMYRVVSAGWLPSTDNAHYRRILRLMTRLREAGIVPYEWIVDGVRSTMKPSSWAGITDFGETVRDAYRKDFWAGLPHYVHVICEKDAIAGTLSPVTSEYDVALSPIRGYSSLSFAHEIACTWNHTDKPVFCYYLGDFDPSGFDLERDIREKLERQVDEEFFWHRLGVHIADFVDFDLLPLPVKQKDKRASRFTEEHGHQCAELDALPSTELRRRVREAIEEHIPQ